MAELTIPGTVLPYREKDGMFAVFRPMVRAASGLTLSQVCAITGLEPSTIQNWVRRGFVPRPVKKKYGERQLARILLISALRDGMQIDCIGELMTLVNGETEDEADDIILEDRLYDCFCLAAAQTEENPDWRGVIRSVVSKEQLAPEAEKRLCPALEVMLHAYLAGVYRQRAAEHLKQLKESVK